MKLKISYRKEQSTLANKSFSPSAQKPEKLISAIESSGVEHQFIDFPPLTAELLSETHSKEYVTGLLNCTISNGFGNRSSDVAKSLPYTTGSFVAAGLEAFRSKSCVLSPTSGFHHAHYNHGGGFCSLNGIIVAAQELLKAGVKKMAIIDLDNHYGDGTESLIAKHNLRSKIDHYTFGGDSVTEATAEQWLSYLPRLLEKYKESEIWLVQLGADPYIFDELGGRLTMDQLYRRDKILFETAKKYRIPVAWNLAGGYAKKFEDVIQIHMNSIKAYFDAFRPAVSTSKKLKTAKPTKSKSHPRLPKFTVKQAENLERFRSKQEKRLPGAKLSMADLILLLIDQIPGPDEQELEILDFLEKLEDL